MTRDHFAGARSVADAVLYEGYVLYPYRASSAKNQLRWQFGVLVPQPCADADGSERSTLRAECIVDPGQTPDLVMRVRFLQIQHRSIEALAPDGESYQPVDALTVDGVRWVEWDEALEREIDIDPLRLLPIDRAAATVPFAFPAADESEALVASDGALCGRIVRRREEIEGVAHIEASWADGPGAFVKVTATVDNPSTWTEPGASRETVMRRSLVGVHLLLGVDDGTFVSLLDPPADAVEATAGCVSEGTYPVLVGEGTSDDVVLSSPIILYDHPVIAPESQGDMCDATEIDEILALRVLTLTEDEKAEARGTDPRSASIVDRWEDMPPEIWERMHGAVRAISPATTADEPEPEPIPWWEPAVDAAVDPWSDTMRIGQVDVAKGTRVRLNPSRRADAHDMFVAGKAATVAGVFHDVDGAMHVAVTVDDDPASIELDWQGRYLFFHPDEIQVLG